LAIIACPYGKLILLELIIPNKKAVF